MKRRDGHRIVIFRDLGLFSALFAVLASMLGKDVRYLKLSTRLAKDNIAARLAGLGVNALTYEDVDDGLGKYCRLLSKWSRILFCEHVRNVALESAIADELALNANARERFSLACEHYFQSELEEPVELLLFCRELQAQYSTVQIVIVSQIDVPLRLLFGRAGDGENWRLWALPRIPFLNYVRRLLARYVRLTGRASVTPGGNTVATHVELNPRLEQRVIYFPHQGLFFGDLFAKDHYYSKDALHELHPSKILHVSLGEDAQVLAQSHAYYREHGIPYVDLMHLVKASPKTWLAQYMRLIRTVWQGNPVALKLIPLQTYKTILYFARYSHLQLLLGGVNQFGRARLALVGYDILFPPMLSAALAACSIPVVATQERFFAVFYNTFRLGFDYYFPLGARACRHIRDNPATFAITHCIPVGPVRSELITNQQAAIPKKYLAIKENHLLVLGLDWHSAPTAVENARVKTNTWRANKRYYSDMIRLAGEFPQIHVVIKGRDNSSLIPEMESVCDEIEAMPNMSIERDHLSYPPSLMAAAADLTIACHTSLVDELLAVGRPAISYDFCGFPTGLFDYDGHPVIVRTYEELRKRVSIFLASGEIMKPEQFNYMRGDFYNVIPGESSPRNKLQWHLDRILHSP